mmetsp:Transcript_40154/g.99234  ORF Transcript_40154/g.99234 Transcript_40154/m.99234 type:complete len:204 (+) Transcript_40154:1345-1956(+)
MDAARSLARAPAAALFLRSASAPLRRCAVVCSSFDGAAPATAESSEFSWPDSPETSAYSKASEAPMMGTAQSATSASCHAPKMNMSEMPTAIVARLAMKVPSDSPVTAATSVTSRVRLAERLAALFSGLSNQAISCRSMLAKALARSRRVSRSLTTPRPQRRRVCSRTTATATPIITRPHRSEASRTSAGVGRKKSASSSVKT